jgi:hypothetical protein
MSELLAVRLMLLPPLMAVVVLVGVPLGLGIGLFRYLRGYLPRRHPSAARVLHARDRRSGGDRRRRQPGTPGGHHAMGA